MGGCIALARVLGPKQTAEELLPQCWEQVHTHGTSHITHRAEREREGDYLTTEVTMPADWRQARGEADPRGGLVRPACWLRGAVSVASIMSV
jgi:hypothetical protein